jgi:hypothetical protein
MIPRFPRLTRKVQRFTKITVQAGKARAFKRLPTSRRFRAAFERENPIDQILDLRRILTLHNLVIFFVPVGELHAFPARDVMDELGLSFRIAFILRGHIAIRGTHFEFIDRMTLQTAALARESLRGIGVERAHRPRHHDRRAQQAECNAALNAEACRHRYSPLKPLIRYFNPIKYADTLIVCTFSHIRHR